MDDKDFVGIQTNIEEVILKLQVVSGLLSPAVEIKSDLPSSASLIERLLTQNAELTGFVSKLSEEKNNLRNEIMKLEEELRRHQHRDSSLHNETNVDAVMASEKEIWNKEKSSLQQSLKQAEAELAKLRAELRNKAFLRELGSDSENAALKNEVLVRRWQQVTGYNFIGINRDGYSQNMGNDLQPDSFSGSMELCGEHRTASYRSRSKLESLRSPFGYQHRYQGIHTDLNPVSLACSQLQNYDPDRALTDYINRLEALQKQLGTVQSASASQTQLHSGIRR